jgi:hypothetical protein
MRFRMRVVFPLPRKPVIIVTGVGVMLADGLGNCLKSTQPFVEASLPGWPYGGAGTGGDNNSFPASLPEPSASVRTLQVGLSPMRLALERS